MHTKNLKFETVQKIPRDVVSIQDRYQVKTLLSSKGNGQGIVYLVSNGDYLYAAKIFKDLKDYETQVNFLSQVKQAGKYVLELKDCLPNAKIKRKQKGYFFTSVLITKYYKYGDLCDFKNQIKRLPYKKKTLFTVGTSLALLEQILIGLKNIHQKQVLHRDIKTQNILIDQNFQLVIADFGLASDIKHTVLDEGQNVATICRRPPQSISRGSSQQNSLRYGTYSQVFCCALLFYEMCFTGRLMIEDPNTGGLSVAYKKTFAKWKNSENIKLFQEEVPIQIYHFFRFSLQQNYNQRLSIEQLLSSNLMKLKSPPEVVRKQIQGYLQEIDYYKNSPEMNEVLDLTMRIISHKEESSMETQDEQKRGLEQITPFKQLMLYYQQQFQDIDNESIQFTTDIYSQAGFKCSPPYVFAWIHHYMTESIMKNRKSIFGERQGQQIKECIVQINKQKASIIVGLEVIQNSQQSPEQSEQQMVKEYKVQIEGQLLKREDSKYMINWKSQGRDNYYEQILLTKLEQEMVILGQFQEKNKNK